MKKTKSSNEEYLQILCREGAVTILKELVMGPRRFSKLKRLVKHSTLAKRLKELEDAGLVERTVTKRRPPASEYTLTNKGKEVLNILSQLKRL